MGFASGRGKSLIADLQEWIPQDRHSQVQVGLYNGSVYGSLADLTDEGYFASAIETSPGLAGAEETAANLSALLRTQGWDMAQRPTQLTLEPRRAGSAPTIRVKARVEEVLAAHNVKSSILLKSFSSGHSIDITRQSTSKAYVTSRMQERRGGGILAIGDQGQLGGNDFELLNTQLWSLSVDRISADPTRCWRLGPAGVRGPDLLLRYLRALRRTHRNVLRFEWDSQ